jgi:hypothetical protein
MSLAVLLASLAMQLTTTAAPDGPLLAQAATAPAPPAGAASSTTRTAMERKGAPPSTAAPSLDGIWMFDAAHSDDPGKVMRAAAGGRSGGMRGGGNWGGGGRGGRGGHGGFGGGPPEGEGGSERGVPPGDLDDDHPRVPQGGNPMQRVLHPPGKIVIELQALEVNVAEDEREPRHYAIQDSLEAKQRDYVTDGTSARWKNGRLVMTQQLRRAATLVETYELSRDGRTLTIHARREGGPEGMPNPTLTRVYTRYDGD